MSSASCPADSPVIRSARGGWPSIVFHTQNDLSVSSRRVHVRLPPVVYATPPRSRMSPTVTLDFVDQLLNGPPDMAVPVEPACSVKTTLPVDVGRRFGRARDPEACGGVRIPGGGGRVVRLQVGDQRLCLRVEVVAAVPGESALRVGHTSCWRRIWWRP
jgi:hypothetical protein